MTRERGSGLGLLCFIALAAGCSAQNSGAEYFWTATEARKFYRMKAKAVLVASLRVPLLCVGPTQSRSVGKPTRKR